MIGKFIEIAEYLKLPKYTIIYGVIILLTASTTGYISKAYFVHQANLNKLTQVYNMQVQLSAKLNQYIPQNNNKIDSLQTQLTGVVIVIERGNEAQLKMLADLCTGNERLLYTFNERQNYIQQIMQDYLPKVNPYQIGVKQNHSNW